MKKKSLEQWNILPVAYIYINIGNISNNLVRMVASEQGTVWMETG